MVDLEVLPTKLDVRSLRPGPGHILATNTSLGYHRLGKSPEANAPPQVIRSYNKSYNSNMDAC